MVAKEKLEEMTFMSLLVLMFVIAISLGMVATSLVVMAYPDDVPVAGAEEVEAAEPVVEEPVVIRQKLPEDEIVVEEEEPELIAFKEYLKGHTNEQDFGCQFTRINHLEVDGDKATLRFREGEAEGPFESWYLAGALFMAFPEIKIADVSCYNENSQLVNNSWKYPTRDIYVPVDKYFTAEELAIFNKIECETDADCEDNNECTIDKCYKQKCSNAWVVNTKCGGGLT